MNIAILVNDYAVGDLTARICVGIGCMYADLVAFFGAFAAIVIAQTEKFIAQQIFGPLSNHA